MSSTTLSLPVSPRHGLSFGGIVRSETLKLLSIRSTLWVYAAFAAITIGAAALTSELSWADGRLSEAGMQAAAAYALAGGGDLNILAVSALGVLVFAGEYSTGMIQSTFTAVPRRVPAVVAKFLVFAAVTSLVGFLASLIAIPVVLALLARYDVQVRLDDPSLWLVVLGNVGYMTAVGLIALGIGAILRNIAGGVTVALGILFVLPAALGLIGGLDQPIWLQNAALFLPMNLGAALTAHPGYGDFVAPGVALERPDGLWALEPWQGALVLSVWVVALFVTALVLVKRRDA